MNYSETEIYDYEICYNINNLQHWNVKAILMHLFSIIINWKPQLTFVFPGTCKSVQVKIKNFNWVICHFKTLSHRHFNLRNMSRTVIACCYLYSLILTIFFTGTNTIYCEKMCIWDFLPRMCYSYFKTISLG